MFKQLTYKSLHLSFQPCLKRFYASGNKLKVLFFGTDDFASTHLNALLEEQKKSDTNIASIDLVCPPDRRTGRKLAHITPSDTKLLAEAHNIPIFHTPPDAKTLDDWHVPSEEKYDLGVVVSFGYFIPPHIIASLKHGAVNVHPSLLPKYRGAAPIQHALLYGDRETGVTVQELDDREFDAGRILAQETKPLTKAMRYSELKTELSQVGSRLLVDTVSHIMERKKNAISQDVSLATKAQKIKKELSELDFYNTRAWQAEQLSRAIGEQYPLRTMYSYERKRAKATIGVQLLNVYLPSHTNFPSLDREPGSFVYHQATSSLLISLADETVLCCTHLKIENKGVISASDFTNGYNLQHSKKGRFDVSIDPKVSKMIEKKLSLMKRFKR
ncbi:Methionyl-tRNA formyltransferase [Backusella circina FSU 941]|nr:Methionyl-tRNA formyltransferase [Backusella circina FSU 941]